MASEDSFSTAQSTTQESGRPETKWRSPVWAYCRDPNKEDEENPEYLYCQKCTLENSPKGLYSSNISTNIKNYFFCYYQIVIKKTTSKIQAIVVYQLEQFYLQAKADSQVDNFDSQVLKSHLNIAVILEALITLIVVRNLPFCIVEWPEFHVFCQALNSQCEGFINTAHSTIRNKIADSWASHKDIVRRDLQSAISNIHLSLDIWTSPNGYLLLAICAHYTNHLLQKAKALLALRKVAGHSGENQFQILLPVIQDYSIVRKLGAIVADNASPNNTLCQVIEHYMLVKEDRSWAAERWRICCSSYIINLAVQAFLFANVVSIEELESYEDEDIRGEGDEETRKVKFRLIGLLGKIYNIVVYI